MSAINGERLIFGQKNGPALELKVFGDEFYARYESLDGYTVVYDLDRGKYCYAYLQDGHFASTGKPIHKPAPMGIHKHLKEYGPVRNANFRKKYDMLRSEIMPLSATSNVMRTYGPNSGLLPGRQVSQGQVKGLTILVEFQDETTSITNGDVDAMLNDMNFQANGNYCSVRKYFHLMSDGKLDYTNRVVGPIRLSRKRSYYINNSLIEEALITAVNQYNLDLSEFDSKGEGIVDAISFMYAGRTQYLGELWPHNFIKKMTINNYRTHFYTIQSLGRNRIDLSIGTFAHESGHMLCRFPDLYDYGQRDEDFEKSSGLGKYCLMSWGNHLNGGKTPSPVCGYLRDLAGWCSNELILNNPGDFDAKHGDYGTVMRYHTNKSHEYFIVENRNKDGLDRFLPDAGLAVYHCDTRGSNEYQDGTPDNHYQCALIQADGHLDLENYINGGDAGDLFENIQGIALSDETNPHSREWDGTDSGLLITNVGNAQAIMSFNVGGDGGINEIRRTVVADQIIPDNGRSIVSELDICEAGTVSRVEIDVHITHTYQGDLEVKLEAPMGEMITLHENQGGPMDNLVLNLDSDHFRELSHVIGRPMAGPWRLHVQDLLQDDVGRLDYWTLSLDYQSVDHIIKREVAPELAIPDENRDGKQSPIVIENEGKVKGLSVEVDITHDYAGDLQVELISPSGQHALLHSSNGDNRTNLRETYTEESTASLRALIGEEINGEWMLHVRDLVPEDEGILNKWAITLRT